MKTKIITIIVLWLVHCHVFSNDCFVATGKNDEIIGVHATNVSMREEVIEITLREDYYEVDVTFDFFNSGAVEKVLLGFPVWNMASGPVFDSDAYEFKSYINGKIVPLHSIKEKHGLDPDPVITRDSITMRVKWFVRKVTFPANSRTVSRVTYKSKYGVCNTSLVAGYTYGTGMFWNGGIGKMTVIINHDDDVIIDGFLPFDIDYKDAFSWEANGRYKYVLKNVQPPSERSMIFLYVQPLETGLYGKDLRWSTLFGVHPDDLPPLCSTAYHGWPWNKCLLYNAPSEIKLFTKNQLRLFINHFFAMHGYDFKNPIYKNYFQNMAIIDYENDNDTIYRYKVNPNFRERDFNEFERKNIDYLLNLEKMIPLETKNDRP